MKGILISANQHANEVCFDILCSCRVFLHTYYRYIRNTAREDQYYLTQELDTSLHDFKANLEKLNKLPEKYKRAICSIVYEDSIQYAKNLVH